MSLFPFLGCTASGAAGTNIGRTTFTSATLSPGVCISSGTYESYLPFAMGGTFGAGCVVVTYSEAECTNASMLGSSQTFDGGANGQCLDQYGKNDGTPLDEVPALEGQVQNPIKSLKVCCGSCSNTAAQCA